MLLQVASVWEFQLLDPDWDDFEVWAAPAGQYALAVSKKPRPPAEEERILSAVSIPREPTEKDLIKWRMENFPHTDDAMREAVAREFLAFGRDDAKRRGISDDGWLWKRSRFTAGFR